MTKADKTADEIARDGFGCFTGWAHHNFKLCEMRVTRGWQRCGKTAAMGLL
jgi:hypothetical protein